MHIPESTQTQPVAMQIPTAEYEIMNQPSDFDCSEDIAEYFSLTARSNTKLARRTPEQDEITAPMVLKRLRRAFVLCEVTVAIDAQVDWDQGGLAIFAGHHPAQNYSRQQASRSLRAPYVALSPMTRQIPTKWARVALEMIGGELNISTLVANPKCGVDWASLPAFPFFHPEQLAQTSTPSVRLKLESVGADLWIWFMVPHSDFMSMSAPSPETVRRQWLKCREIVNFFDDISAKSGLWIGCYASRPLEDGMFEATHHNEGLFVEFEDLVIL